MRHRMTQIIAENISVEFPIASNRARSIKNAALAKASRIGGKLLDREITAVRALEGVNFHLKEGDRLGLYGPNGAGKTTLLRALAGAYTPTNGRLQIVGRLLSLLDISVGLDAESTGYENIYLRGLVMGMSEEEITSKTAEIAEFSELGAYLDLPMRTYSSGMLLRLAFSIATSIEGDIILMDEWLSVGDQEFRFKAQERLLAMTERIGILVLASHERSLLRQLCNLALRLEHGRVVGFGPIDEVLPIASP